MLGWSSENEPNQMTSFHAELLIMPFGSSHNLGIKKAPYNKILKYHCHCVLEHGDVSAPLRKKNVKNE